MIYMMQRWSLSLSLGRWSGYNLGDFVVSVLVPLRPIEPPLPVPGTQLTWTQARLHVYPGVAAALHSVVPTTRLGVSTSMTLTHKTNSEHLFSAETVVSCHEPVLYHGLIVHRMVVHRYPMQSPRIR